MPRAKTASPATAPAGKAPKVSRAKSKSAPSPSPAPAPAPAPEVPSADDFVSEAISINHQIGDYVVKVERKPETTYATWQLVSESEAIAAEGRTEPETLTYPGLKTIERSAEQRALEEGIKAFNRQFPLSPGEVEVSRLFPSPANALIYDASTATDDLVKLLEKGIELDEIVVSPSGEILRGNTRFLAAIRRNIEAEKEKSLLPHPTLKARLVEIEPSLESTLEYIREGNTYRNKTPADLKREALLAAQNLAYKPASLEATRKEAERVGISQKSMENLTALQRAIKDEKVPKDLADALREIAKENPANAVDIVRVKPPEGLKVETEDYQRAIAAKIPEGKALKGKSYSFVAAKALVDKELAAAASGNPLVEQAIAAGDHAQSNRHTPPSLIELASRVMGQIDLDAFASLPNPDYVGKIVNYPVKAYTILDNAWVQPIQGKVFANPPWHRASESIALLESWVRKGTIAGISKLFLVVPQSVTSNRSVQNLIDDFGFLICHPNYRVEYARGEVLQAIDPNAVEGNIRDTTVVLFYSCEAEDYDAMAAEFPGWCGFRYVPKPLPAPVPKPQTPNIKEFVSAHDDDEQPQTGIPSEDELPPL